MEVTMTLQQLPERANLEQLKKQAKSLLAAARSQEPNAIQRFEAVLIGRSLKPDAIALHDAQFVLAREYGSKSWTELKQEVEERSLSFAAAVDEFVRCATDSAAARRSTKLGAAVVRLPYISAEGFARASERACENCTGATTNGLEPKRRI